MQTEVVIPYGEQTQTVQIPSQNLAWVTGPKETPPLADLKGRLRAAIRSPIQSPGLPALARTHGPKTVILVDDGTRSTPQEVILPILLDELNAAGIPDRHISILIALGTHRPMTREECVRRYGCEVMGRVAVENLSQEAGDFVHIGTTPLGVPVSVSRRYLESDISIAVGNIIPHMYAGWSGGAKMVQPGMTSPETTAKTHLMAGPHVYEILGNVDNPVRLEMERIAVQSGLKFIVNVVLNRSGHVVDVVAGDVIAAHRAGVEIAREIYTVTVDEDPDIVIAGSHPADRDLWQGFKPINNCGMLVKDGGTLIVVLPAPEGTCPDHPQLLELGTTPDKKVLELVDAGRIRDGVAAATYLALDRTRRRIRIVVVTDGFTHQEAQVIGLTATPHLRHAVAMAMVTHGPRARIGVITHGADIMRRRSSVPLGLGLHSCPDSGVRTSVNSDSCGVGSFDRERIDAVNK